ncbi:Fmn dependent [Favolaschia claudopus]|uniref:Fmn dependent n=1 Tax=Favolaschia claudopus TaxID=2862362 RepID=A0AAV9ZCY0_9AGAR
MNPTAHHAGSTYMLEVYRNRQGLPPLGTAVFEELEAKAREKFEKYPGVFMYAGGSAGTNSTYWGNVRAFERYRIVPRMLVDATIRSLEVRIYVFRKTTIFGVTYPSPLFIAPIGVQGLFSPEGELAAAAAGKNLTIPFIMSNASSRSIEDVATANGTGHRWYQLYWPASNSVTLSILARAKTSGFAALLVTLDTHLLGWRAHDMARSYLPFAHGVGVQVGMSDPVFMARMGRAPQVSPRTRFPYDAREMDRALEAGDKEVRDAVDLGMEWLREMNSGLFRDWEDVKFLRENWEGPLVLKGIQSVPDAEKALECGVDGIVVSNHGGRQVDGAIPSLEALVRIMRSAKVREAQAAGKFTILFDSGVRTGSDIFKALALGAQGVLLGRPWLYGAAVAGQEGIEQVLKMTLADLDTTLGLSGYRSISEIQGKGEEVLVEVDL